MTVKSRVLVPLLGVTFGAFLFSSCGGDEKPTTVEQPSLEQSKKSWDGQNNGILEIDGTLFSIPSPIQTAFLIKNSGAAFNPANLNASDNISNYSTKYKQALNLGIYGADLGYVTIYDVTEDALGYLKSVRSLADELGVTGAFDEELITRFRDNLGKQDSVLQLVADAYRAGDNYLKSNDRNEVASLILAGGWIEALYFAIQVAEENKSPMVINRIGEQKGSLYSLIGLLSKYASTGSEYEALISDLNDLYYVFESLDTSYEYVAAETKPEQKLTIIKSKTSVTVTPEKLAEITQKVNDIRSQIVG